MTSRPERDDRLTIRGPGRSCGFTLLEVLVAGVILALTATVIFGISSRCLSQARIDHRREAAWEILDRQLNLISLMGIDAFVEQDVRSMPVERDETTYLCTVKTDEEPIGYLYRVDIMVQWVEEGRKRRITAATMFQGQPPLDSGLL